MITSLNNTHNTGIVPPWLLPPAPSNPGPVPPWLRDEFHILPVEDEFTILPVNPDGETQFVREPISYSPTTLINALRMPR